LREYEDETLLIVNNLARFAQPVELDLSQFEGWTPVELFGNTPFPRIGALPYMLTFGPHGFMWFRLVPPADETEGDGS
jgi:maltose alpha-D-glucosyltransferase/alpha-amylase